MSLFDIQLIVGFIIQKWLIDSLNEENASKHNYLGQAIQTFRLQIDKATELDAMVEKVYPHYYENVYSLNVLCNDKSQLIESIEKEIGIIKKQNLEQGKDGKYIGYAYDSYEIIANILLFEKIELDSNTLSLLLDVIKETIYSKTQVYKAKINSIYLLTILSLWKFRFNGVLIPDERNAIPLETA